MRQGPLEKTDGAVTDVPGLNGHPSDRSVQLRRPRTASQNLPLLRTSSGRRAVSYSAARIAGERPAAVCPLSRAAHVPSMTIVQEITVWWTKTARSAPGATVRNAVPECFDLPFRPATMARFDVVRHGVLIREWTGFGDPEETVEGHAVTPEQPLRLGCVRIEPGPDAAQVVYTYDFACGGAPERTSRPRPVLRLRAGQWGRVVYNGRFEDRETRDWLYKKVVANVAHVADPSEAVFQGEPSKTFSDLAHLR